MRLVRPFRGYRYATNAQDISNLCCPPYDVISDEQRETLASRDPHNAVELELGEGALDLETPNNRYVTTAARWREWISQGTLVQDAAPCLYVLEQRFTYDGIEHARTSVIGEVRLHDFSEKIILPHERTLPKALGDRFRLTKTTHANFSPVFGLYSEPSPHYFEVIEALKAGEPTQVATDDAGIVSSVWAVSEPATVAEFCEMLENRQVFIADGHHRYTIALTLRDELREQRYGVPAAQAPSQPDFDADAGFEYVMMALSNMDDPQLLLLPYHRAIRAFEGFSADAFIERLSELFDVRDGSHDELEACETPSFLFKTRGRELMLASLKPSVDVDQAIGGEHCADWKRLDVAVLQELVFAPIFGIDYNRPETLSRLAFSKNEDELLAECEDGDLSVAFIMRAVKFDELRHVSTSGETMPQKSTYFYPKLPTGFVYRSLD
jgi:uncharacterized protein (DUF1015 family)